ncbi:MAG: hypothetical protein QOG91_578 [Candidatus Parcubacteria bacterium]|jgi:prepilin-type N-terminal cleavage/methylation domain-containing protein|nr:hypothetical protein [Candidatus Parcubacteria bacterium]
MTKLLQQFQQRLKRKQRGFTLLEMLVSLAIFVVVAVIAVGSLVRITALNRQAQTLQSSMTNLNFVLESISREMRLGSKFYCGGAMPSATLAPAACYIAALASPDSPGITYLAFLSTRTKTKADNSGQCQLINAYRLNTKNGKIFLEKGLQRTCEEGFTDQSFASVLDDANVTLTGYQLGVYIPASKYAWAYIRLKGYSGVRAQDINYFDVQTSISERIHD